MQKGKINIITLGCSKNVVDSEKLIKQLQSGGYSVFHDNDNFTGDTVIINTCGFINDAREESIDTILRYVREKESGSIKNLYVMGCLSERYAEALREEIPEVDRYFGVHDIKDILEKTGVEFRRDLSVSRHLSGPGHYAYLKISEGCDRRCSFCAIPAIRGKYVSGTFADIIAEADQLGEMGVKELILVAQDLSYYGSDLYKRKMLTELLEELLKLKRFEWIRLHYLYPDGLPEQLTELIRDNGIICRYIDLPIQHISDKMLRLMHRSHTRAETEAMLNRIREEIPGAAVRTTLIAGHPGETDEDYKELLDFVKEFRFERLGVFPYSHEEGTYSSGNYEDDVPDDVKSSRVAGLMEVQQSVSAALNEKLRDQILKVIIDRREDNFYIGRTEFDSPEVDQEVLISTDYDLLTGNFYAVKIIDSTEFDLFGIPV